MERRKAPILMRKSLTPYMLVKICFKSVSNVKKKVIKKVRH